MRSILIICTLSLPMLIVSSLTSCVPGYWPSKESDQNPHRLLPGLRNWPQTSTENRRYYVDHHQDYHYRPTRKKCNKHPDKPKEDEDDSKLNEYLNWLRRHTTVYNYRFAGDEIPYSPSHEGGPPPTEGWQPPKIDPSLLAMLPTQSSSLSPSTSITTRQPVSQNSSSSTISSTKPTKIPSPSGTPLPNSTSFRPIIISTQLPIILTTKIPGILSTSKTTTTVPVTPRPVSTTTDSVTQVTMTSTSPEPITTDSPGSSSSSSMEESTVKPEFVCPENDTLEVQDPGSTISESNETSNPVTLDPTNNNSSSSSLGNIETSGQNNSFVEVSQESGEHNHGDAGHGVCSCIIRRPQFEPNKKQKMLTIGEGSVTQVE